MPSGIYDATLGALTLKQVRSVAFDWGAMIAPAQFSGGIDNQQYTVDKMFPRATLEAHDLAGVIAAVSATVGLAVAAGSIVIPFQVRAQGGTFSGGANHHTISSANGLILPRRFSARQSDPLAAVSLEVLFRSADGITVPVTFNSSQSLGAQAFNVTHKLGPVKADSVEMGNVVGVSVDPGIRVEPVYTNGLPFPTALHIVKRDPTITVEFEDMATLAQWASGYEAISALVAYFRKRTSGGTVVSDITAEHCSFSFTGGIKQMERTGGSGQGNVQNALRFHGDTLVISGATAIT